ncbi:type I polyketide synthase [Streptomyces sp. SID11385]|uniref:type I polyketide synthase n=1 Tax=Streptomyces sp. SID11385 TaxID=2706031 RepID=UPI001942A9EB|nr:type I polyketide synthase [Streptomyces sp. SID11385]
MDPQQRLLLETSWEALERAGIDPTSLRGSRTGVYAGLMYHDYGPYLFEPVEGADGHRLTGGAGSVLSGRVSYAFGLEGPAVTVDTACSSSLVTLHLAVRALRGGECTLALAGGATVMSSPGTFVEFSRQKGLSPDGRCKSFSAQADGTGWSEGVGVLVLERLSDALRNGHTVLATIRGSAVNQDGASNGLTAPNGPSQQRVIQAALTDARLGADGVDAVEAHGTGTRLGDPIEAQALLNTYGQSREGGRPLWLGSLKSNIGHTQAAAGVGGVIKMVEAIRRGKLPRTLHAEEPSPFVDWDSGAVRLLTSAQPWPETARPRRAAVSSFGISGTNAHVIIEQAPVPEDEDEAASPEANPPAGPVPVPLSARTPAALGALARRLADRVDGEPVGGLSGLALSLATRRAELESRAVVLADGVEGLRTALTSLASAAEDGSVPGVVRGTPVTGPTAFLFSGQGSQRPGMGRELYEIYPAFAAALDEVCAHLDPHLDRPLRDLMFAAEDSPEAALLQQTQYTQTSLFALQVALHRLLEHLGIRPKYLAGHSIGELAAAHAAGILTLPDACTLVAARGRLMQQLPPGGTMLAVRATEHDLTPHLTHHNDISIAALNSPTATVLSGTTTTLNTLNTTLTQLGHTTRFLRVSHAFHSPLMNPILEEFRHTAEQLTYHHPHTPLITHHHDHTATPEELTTPDYWVQHIRNTVHFHHTITTLADRGTTTYLEIGPDTTLTALARETLTDTTTNNTTTPQLHPTLRKNHPETTTLTQTLAHLWTNGTPLNWHHLLHHPTPHHHNLPTYPFQHRRYWQPNAARRRNAPALGLGAVEHPFLGAALTRADSGETVFTGRLSLNTQPWLADHEVLGQVLLPGTAFVEMSLRAGESTGCEVLEELTLESPLVLTAQGAVRVQVIAGAPDESGRRALAVYAQRDGEDEETWVRHASGWLAPEDEVPGPRIDPWPPVEAESVGLASRYEDLAEQGFGYGPAFQGLRAVWRRGSEVFAEVRLPEDGAEEAPSFGLHPALLDAALHAIELGALPGSAAPRLPFVWSGVRLHATGAAAARVRLTPVGPAAVAIEVADATGAPIASVESLAVREVSADQLRAPGDASQDSLFRSEWVPAPAGSSAGSIVPTVVRLEGAEGPEAVHDTVRAALELAQEWLAKERPEQERLVVLTRGAVAVADEDVTDLAAAAAWGLLRSAQTENPDRIVLVDVEDLSDEEAVRSALDTGDGQLAVRGGRAFTPRLTRVASEGSAFPALDPEGTVLITGATGALGALFARYLVTHHHVTHLLLVSRRGPDAPHATTLTQQLTDLGATVTLTACDIADPTALHHLLDTIPTDHPLTGIIHAAGTLDDATLTTLTPQRLTPVLRPKTDAAHHLHHATQHLDLPLFALFSSIQGLLGGAGQANYAAANAYLDALARHRRARGLAAVSLAWGPWAEGGMAARLGEADRGRFARQGMLPISSEEGLRLFDAAVSLPLAGVVPLPLDRAALRSGAAEPPALLRGLVPVRQRKAAASGARAEDAGQPALADRLAGMPAQEREEHLEELVCAEVARTLGYEGSRTVDARRGFKELGIESLTAVELRNRLNKATGLRLPATLVFDHPTPTAVARLLLTSFAASSDAVAEERASAAPLGDTEIRRLLSELPLDRLRGSGLLDRLVDLAGPRSATASDVAGLPGPDTAPTTETDIDELDIDALIRMAGESHES